MRLNAGIIGLGWFAGMILKSLEGAREISVTAAADIDEKKAEEFRQKFNLEKIYDNADDIIIDPAMDIIIISTPPHMHSRLAEKALLAGKHIFLEKPGALNPEDMRATADLAVKRNLKATVDFVMRRNPLYLILKRLCENNIFGLPERASLENHAHDDSLSPRHWFWDYKKSGGIWVEHGVHFFDLADWLLGLPTHARGSKYRREGCDFVDRVLGTAFHQNGAIVSYYHGFTKPEVFEKTSFSLVFERAYTKAEGWIPVTMVVDAMVTPMADGILIGDILEEARRFLPGIGVNLEKRELKRFDDDGVFRGRGKHFRASARMEYIFSLDRDRWEVYRACVRQGILDLVRAVKGQKTEPDVTLEDAKNALDVAYMMEGE
ncbi:MAG: Gfo/Idh/MocA family oxidoreductase [Tepidanaerobacteraceae bacterium]|jgi:predicted dehydrogenase|nr:Gfo/Idh/MocA family oxidoreductase [Tepidanaerobacteraceae bacterium]